MITFSLALIMLLLLWAECSWFQMDLRLAYLIDMAVMAAFGLLVLSIGARLAGYLV